MTHNARVQVFLSVDFNTRAHRADKISSAKFAEKKNQSKHLKTKKKQKTEDLHCIRIVFPLLHILPGTLDTMFVLNTQKPRAWSAAWLSSSFSLDMWVWQHERKGSSMKEEMQTLQNNYTE